MDAFIHTPINVFCIPFYYFLCGPAKLLGKKPNVSFIQFYLYSVDKRLIQNICVYLTSTHNIHGLPETWEMTFKSFPCFIRKVLFRPFPDAVYCLLCILFLAFLLLTGYKICTTDFAFPLLVINILYHDILYFFLSVILLSLISSFLSNHSLVYVTLPSQYNQ